MKGETMRKAKSPYLPPEVEVIVFYTNDSVLSSTSATGDGFMDDPIPDHNVDSDW